MYVSGTQFWLDNAFVRRTTTPLVRTSIFYSDILPTRTYDLMYFVQCTLYNHIVRAVQKGELECRKTIRASYFGHSFLRLFSACVSSCLGLSSRILLFNFIIVSRPTRARYSHIRTLSFRCKYALGAFPLRTYLGYCFPRVVVGISSSRDREEKRTRQRWRKSENDRQYKTNV